MFAIKIASFLLLSIISVWSAESEFTCPRRRGYFPHPHQCKKYYVCMNSKSTLETCPDQMLFDIEKRNCFTRSKVNCGERIQGDQTEIPVNDSSMEQTSSQVLNGTFSNTPFSESYNVTSNTPGTSVDEFEWLITNNTGESVTDVISNFSTHASREENITYTKLEWVTDSNKLENVSEVILDVNSTVVPAISSTGITDIDTTTEEFEWITYVIRFENVTNSTVDLTSTAESFINATTREESTIDTEFEWVTSSSSLENSTNSVSNVISTLTPPSKTDFTEVDVEETESTTKDVGTTLSDYDDDYAEDIFTCPEMYGLFPHPTNRHKYIHCQEWYPHILTCPANLVFDNIKKVCVWRIKRH